MVLMFDKETLEGRWFRDTELETGPEDTTGYTDKVPPSTAYAFDEESGEWVQKEAGESGDGQIPDEPPAD